MTALRKAAELEVRRSAFGEAATLVRQHAERLAARGWRLTSLLRYRKLSELLLRVPPAEQGAFTAIEGDVQRLRAEIATQRKALATHDQMARTFEQSGDDARLIEISRKMVSIQPDNPVYQARLAEALCRTNRTDEAILCFRVAAEALTELDRIPDALRVVERILHFRASPEDSLLAAALYLERGESNDAVRAVGKLSATVRADPENLDAMLLLSRAFDAMRQPSRAVQVLLETARAARTAGEIDLCREIGRALDRAAEQDAEIWDLVQADRELGSAPDANRSALMSVADAELLDEYADDDSEESVLEDVELEEISEIWVVPVQSPATRRALDDAEAFSRLHLFPKAESVLRAAILLEPTAPDLREALRHLQDSMGNPEGYYEETLALADLYREKDFLDRAGALCAELLARFPDDEAVRVMAHEIDLDLRRSPQARY